VDININTLKSVLKKYLKKDIVGVNYEIKELHGGTVGNVYLITGIAEISEKKLPFRLVYKISKKWERFGDVYSWRREYDLYASNLGSIFLSALKWPECYHFELNDNEIQLWMEYIDGISGLDLTPEMCERSAYELGRLQGKIYTEKPTFLQNIKNLSQVNYVKNFYLHYRSWDVVYDYIRSDNCEIPKNLCKMLIDFDNDADEVFNRIEKLPIVFCHRDFWVANIFNTNGKTILIDWDTTGWGYLGEDIASLIADEADIENMIDNYRICILAYYKGFSEYTNESSIADHCIFDFILALFGYRIIERYIYAEKLEDKIQHIRTLQKIYEFNKIKFN